MNRRAFLARSLVGLPIAGSVAVGELALAADAGNANAGSANAGSADADKSPTRADLLGYWPLRGDSQDHSGNGHHGVHRGTRLPDGALDGKSSFVQVPAHPKLALGTRDFTMSAWVHTAKDLDDVLGDVLCQFDPATRRGFSLSLKSSSGGYSSHGDDRHVYFGIDNGAAAAWEDCGRPSKTSNYVSNSLTVYDGSLYAAITDAEKFDDWCHVFRYAGGRDWEDCGRVGDRRVHGIGPMIVHQGHLFAGAWTYDWNRVGIKPPLDDFCCVYRYEGGTQWTHCGQPGTCRRLFGLASYRGRLYVTAEDGRCYVWDGKQKWSVCGRFPNYAHPMGIHDGRLYAGVLNPAGVWSYDGLAWSPLGNPQGAEERCNQIHAIEVYQGRLYVTTWPEGHVCLLEPDGRWTDCGRLGDSMEINALTVYNGKLYAGAIPYAEVFRYDGPGDWKQLRRFFEPEEGRFRTPNDWARVTSLTVYRGRLFASVGSCTSSVLDAPCDVRGTVWSMEAGKCASYDRDLGAGWKHVTAVRRGGRLELHVDGKREAVSTVFDPSAFDLSTAAPLRIGAGETDYFSGRIREVRFYGRALEAAQIGRLASIRPE